MNPTVSIVMPVFNVENYLPDTLDCILQQTFTDFEVICVDDCSDDRSAAIVEEYPAKDSRIHLLSQPQNMGAGAARNAGFSHASGKYTIFLDSDDLFSEKLLEKTVAEAEETEADIVAFNFSRFDEEGNEEERTGVHMDWLPAKLRTFNYTDCPDRIMNIVNPTPWNKLYKSDFIREHSLRFEEISSTNDITFASVSVAAAGKAAFLKDSLVRYRIGHSGTISSTKKMEGKLLNVKTAVLSAASQAEALPYYSDIKNAVCRFAADNLIFAFKNYIDDIENAGEFYDFLHEYFNSELFDSWSLEACGSGILWVTFQTIRETSFEDYKTRMQTPVTVSLTSFPARIDGVSAILETIYSQTRRPDRVVLWLAKEQFPEKEAELPEALIQLTEENLLEIRWCDDLKPHKKYFYIMQEITEGVLITIDDDLLYSNDMIEALLLSYVRFPKAVSTVRTHLIAIGEEGILPYKYWIKETDIWLGKPSMQLLATGGAGTLYPAGILGEDLFNKEVIQELCPIADDLWMKAMELVYDIPVVLAIPNSSLHYLPGSQETALYHSNINQNENDVQLAGIARYIDGHYGEGFFLSKVKGTDAEDGAYLTCPDEIWLHFSAFSDAEIRKRKELEMKLQRTYDEKSEINATLQRTYGEKSEINAKLKQTYAEKSEINAKLQQTYAEKSEINEKLQQAYAEKSEINAKLKRTYAEKTEINQKLQTAYKEKTERGIRIKELEKSLAQTKEELMAIKNSLPYKAAAKMNRELHKIPFPKKDIKPKAGN